MELNYYRDIVGDVAVVTTILQFLSGALVCKQYVSNRTTGESSPLPFITCKLSCSLWLMYGITKNDGKIVLVNFVGITLMIVYTYLFYMYTIKKSAVIKQFLITVGLFLFVLLFASAQEDKQALQNVLGWLAAIFTLVTVSAPMSKLLYVIRVKNTECLPFPIILMTFLVSSLWTLYGYIVNDAFLQCVNVIGVVLAVAQLSLFLVYPSAPSSPLLPKSMVKSETYAVNGMMNL
ncbi:sugar efflux transporter for intercellular exchange domain-containing protein [Phthorimaea operculella]|nr:sugar efflux transporter for intercellular exchange domain-containing protein [Phthorimaea operculella]